MKVLLLLGGDFNGIEASGAVQTLVENIAAFEKQYGYQGVDIDWEYPATTVDRKFLVELMAKLRKSNPDYVLSIDAAPWGGYGYNLKQLQISLDYVNIMMYDCAGPWTAYGQLNSPIFWDNNDPAPWECQPGGSVNGTANIFLKHMPAQQLNMGTPFYGYHYTNINQLFGLCPNAAYTADGACDDTVLTVNYGPDSKAPNQQRRLENLLRSGRSGSLHAARPTEATATSPTTTPSQPISGSGIPTGIAGWAAPSCGRSTPTTTDTPRTCWMRCTAPRWAESKTTATERGAESEQIHA